MLQKYLMKEHYKNITVVLLIITLGIIFQKNYINEFPSHIHAWAQSDRYAMALRFTDNNLNFFKPETFVLNHQFPHDWQVPSTESITAVDFPIHDYVPAIFMKISGNSSPWIFRLYLLIYSFVGLFFLFQVASILTKDFFKSVLIIILAASSPVFVYYQAGFLPTIPSLSNTFIGIYFYTLYLESRKNKHFNLALLFVTLAALSRSTFAIPLIAIFGYEFIRLIKKEITLIPKIIPGIISVGCLLFFFIYNAYLREKYGSIFLNHFMPASSFQNIIEILQTVKEKWETQYFSMIHYVVFLSLLTLLVLAAILKRVKFSRINRKILHLTLIILAGCILFALLMIRQFPAHDYYFLDTFFLPLILLFTIILSALPLLKSNLNTGIISVSILVIGFLLANNAIETQQSRRYSNSGDRTTATINNFTGAANYLDSLNVPQNAKMLVIGAYAPNIPFILMKRKGYAIMKLNKENIMSALTWNPDYVVMQTEFFLSDVYANYPEILSKTRKIWDNGKILICKLNTGETHQGLDEFLGLNEKIPVKEEIMNYDTEITGDWKNITSTSEVFHSGTRAGTLTKDITYGITYSTKYIPELKEKERLLLFQSWFLCDTIKDVKLVVNIRKNNENIYYNATELQDLLKKQNTWENISLTFKLPEVKNDSCQFSLYLWNPGESALFIDDFGFRIY